ncbi:MAG: DUF4832 domain-containing protein [Acidobacteria bacterium]|nr:DUF4832 domain-containing protein [Acidobacteriota bacterium]
MELITVTPREIFDVLVNPGMGWTTFFSFNGDEINQNHPPSSIAYFRFYWDELEPREGEYRWDIIDELIRIGRGKGQAIALRVMVMDGMEWAAKWREKNVNPQERAEAKNYRVPDWFYRLGSRGKEFFDEEDWPPGTPPLWEPDYGDPIFLEKHGSFVAALGERYDGHPGIDHLDLGSLGRWGEWHCAAVPTPPLEARQRIIDTYLTAFKKTPLLMLIADQEALSYAIATGTGWRADCLGDCRQDFFNPQWFGGTPHFNHMEDVYLQRLVGAKATKAWKKAPVAFEACWSMEHWYEQGWPIHCIFDYALALHCSIFNNKSRPIPEAWRPQVNEFSCRMGYRFVLQSLEHPRVAKCGDKFSVSMVWENKGVAPRYRHDALALRFSSPDGGNEIVCSTTSDPTRWLPGRHVVKEAIELPPTCPPGSYRLSVALVDPATNQPAVKLAIAGRDADGWYPLSTTRIE